MTAQYVMTESDKVFEWATNQLQNEVQKATRKRGHSIDDTETSLSPPPTKSIRLQEPENNSQEFMQLAINHRTSTPVEEKQPTNHEQRTIDPSALCPREILSAYKRIWHNLDLSKPTDAKLEPFVWLKIRQYQQKL